MLEQQAEANDAWLKAGCPRSSRFPVLRGRGRRADGPRDLEIIGAKATVDKRVSAAFQGLLTSGRLLAWGRRESPTFDARPIPSRAWTYLTIKNAERSVVVEKTEARAKFFDVSLYPVLHAPQRLEMLDGMTLPEAARHYVFDDPEVRELGGRAMEIDPSLEQIFIRRSWSPYIPVPWPLWIEAGQVDEDDVIGCLADPKPPAILAATRALHDRLLALLALLRKGELVASGVAARRGDSSEVPRSIWTHRDFSIDLQSGDLLQRNEQSTSRHDAEIKRWLGLMLARPASTTAANPVDLPKTSASARRRSKREAVVAALQTAGINLVETRESYKAIAARIAPLLQPPAKSASEIEALSKMIGRLAKSEST